MADLSVVERYVLADIARSGGLCLWADETYGAAGEALVAAGYAASSPIEDGASWYTPTHLTRTALEEPMHTILTTADDLDAWMEHAEEPEYAIRDGAGVLWLAMTDGDWHALRWCRDGIDCEDGPGVTVPLTDLPRPLTILTDHDTGSGGHGA